MSPTASDVSETKCALFFGSRAMKITNTAYVNVEVRTVGGGRLMLHFILLYVTSAMQKLYNICTNFKVL